MSKTTQSRALRWSVAGATRVLVTSCAALCCWSAQAEGREASAQVEDAIIVDGGQLEVGLTLELRNLGDGVQPLLDGRFRIGLTDALELGLLYQFETGDASDRTDTDGLTRPGLSLTALWMRMEPGKRPGFGTELGVILPLALGRESVERTTLFQQLTLSWGWWGGSWRLDANAGGVGAFEPERNRFFPWWGLRSTLRLGSSAWWWFVEGFSGDRDDRARVRSGMQSAFVYSAGEGAFALDLGARMLSTGVALWGEGAERSWVGLIGVRLRLDAFVQPGTLGDERGGQGFFFREPHPLEVSR